MQDLKKLELRIDALERLTTEQRCRVSRYRRVAVGLGLVVVAMVSFAAVNQQPVDVLRARQLEIVDDTGLLVLRASAGEFGGRLDLWNREGRNIVRVGANEFGGDMALWNGEGINVFGAFAAADGGETSLWNSAGQRMFRGFVTAQGGHLDLHNTRDQPIFSASVDENGGRARISQADGQPLFTFGPGTNGGVMQLFNDRGNPVISAEADERSAGLCTIGAASGEPRLYGGVTDQGAVAHFKNLAGVTIASLGSTKPAQAGSLQLFSATGTPAVALRSQEAGGGKLDLINAEGTTVLTAASVAETGSMLTLLNKGGRRNFVMATRAGGGLMNIRNEMGNPVLIAGADDEKQAGGLSIVNRRGVQAVQLGIREDGGGQIAVWDAEGRKRRGALPATRSFLDQ